MYMMYTIYGKETNWKFAEELKTIKPMNETECSKRNNEYNTLHENMPNKRNQTLMQSCSQNS